jgi:DNA-binding transcriptional LysR family regulator
VAAASLKPRAILRSMSLEAVRRLVGAGIAVLPDFPYRPWMLDAEHVDVRLVRDALPTVDVGLVWRRGSGLKPAATEFIELARETSRARRPGRGTA